MTLSEIRDELLGQHHTIREIVEAVRAAADGAQRGQAGARDQLRDQLFRLQGALMAHNAREEQLLRGVIRKVDAWGDVREALLGEHHQGEHRRLLDALQHAAGDSGAAGSAVLSVLDELLDHMHEEEDKVLHPRVLTDEIAGGDDGFGG